MESPKVRCWDELVSLLNAVKALEKFSSMETYPLAANPVIQIGGHIVTLPLSDNGAETIKQASEHANDGNESRVAVGASACNTWKLENQNFNLLNPGWSSFLEKILDDVRGGLDIIQSVDIQLYKLILCEKHPFCQPQNKDYERSDTLAMLAIYLPSEHQGGTVRISHSGTHCTFDISELSMFATRALAWVSNTTYEEEKTISGRCLKLVYRIVDKTSNRSSLTNIRQPVELVDQALRQCAQEARNVPPKIYLFDQQYSLANLSLSKLKGHDRAICEALKESCPRHGFYFFLGHLRKQLTTTGHSDVDYNALEYTFRMDLLDAVSGDEIAKGLIFTKDQLLSDPYRQDRIVAMRLPIAEVDSGDGANNSRDIVSPEFFAQRKLLLFSRAEDNYIVGVTPTVTKHAAIICPSIHVTSYLYPPQNIIFPNLIQMIMQSMVHRQVSHGYPEDDLMVLEEIVDSWDGIRPGIRSTVTLWAWKNKYRSLFDKVVSSEIGLRVSSETMSAVANIINTDIPDGTESGNIQWDRYFSGAFRPCQDFKNTTLNLEIVENKVRDVLKPSFRIWKQTVQRYMFRTRVHLSIDDIDLFLHSLMPASEFHDWVGTCVVPALSVQGRKSLLREYIIHLLSTRQSGKLDNSKGIADRIILCTYEKAALETSDFMHETYSMSPAKTFRHLICCLLRAGLKTAVDRLLDISCPAITIGHTFGNRLPLRNYQTTIKRFVHDLGGLLQDHHFPRRDSTRDLFEFLVRRYIYSTAPSYPKKLPCWARRPRGCGCGICLELDGFLESEYLVKADFTVRDVTHLESRLPRGVFNSMQRPAGDTSDSRVIYRVHKIKDKEFEQDMESYNAEVLEFEKFLEVLRNPYMEALFGEEDYCELIMLKNVQNSKGQKLLADAAELERRKRKAVANSGNGERQAKRK